MNVLDLFSGIGGFSLGLERAGMRTVAFCEIDPFCRAVLRKHWPDVPVFDDVRTINAKTLADTTSKNAGEFGQENRQSADGQSAQLLSHPCGRGGTAQARNNNGIELICGGFPCQDISVAGKGAGITGERSGLWTEYARIIGELRPRYAIVENVAALLGRGLDTVLGDLAALGYDAEWYCIPASAVGAPHRRDRVWIVAYPSDNGQSWGGSARSGRNGFADSDKDTARADQSRLQGRLAISLRECAEQRFAWAGGFQGWDETEWFAQSGMGRVSNGTANRVDRLRSLGNAIVPQIAEIIGRAILDGEEKKPVQVQNGPSRA